jgi:hypothetical protein
MHPNEITILDVLYFCLGLLLNAFFKPRSFLFGFWIFNRTRNIGFYLNYRL